MFTPYKIEQNRGALPWLALPRIKRDQARSAGTAFRRRCSVQHAMVIVLVHHSPLAPQQQQLVLEVPEVRPHKIGVSSNLTVEATDAGGGRGRRRDYLCRMQFLGTTFFGLDCLETYTVQ